MSNRQHLRATLFAISLLSVSASALTIRRSVTSDPILQISEWSLTDYRGAATAGQDVLCNATDRAVHLDGSQRVAAPLGMHFAGNPFGSPASGTESIGGVQLVSGAVTSSAVDLSLPADGPTWTIGRSYSTMQDAGSHVSNGWQGRNWFQSAHPEIVLAEHSSSDALDTLYLVFGADRFIEFQRVDATSSTYRATNGAAGAVVLTTNNGEPTITADTWTYTDQWSWQYVFFGFDSAASGAEGQIWKIVAPSGEEAYFGDSDLQNDPITLGYDSGKPATGFDSENRRFTFTYATPSSTPRLTDVEVETKSGGSWNGTPTGLETVGLVEYTYYAAESYGDEGDLKTVKITTPLNDDGNSLIRECYYQYWDGTYNASTNPGHPHSMRAFYDFEGIRQYDWLDSLFDRDFDGAAPATLAPYATAIFEYNSSKQCTKLEAGAGCGSCGGSSYGAALFVYEANAGYSDGSGYDEDWMVRAIVERDDGGYVTQYFDEAGQPLANVTTDGDPSTGTPDTWVTSVIRNEDGIVREIGTPASVTAYAHSTGAITTSDTAGLIRYWSLETSGETKGYALNQKYNRDLNGSRYFESSRTYVTNSLTVGDTHVDRPMIADTRDYPDAITTGLSGSNLTQRSFTWHAGTLAVDELSTTYPQIIAANNGSGLSNSTRVGHDAVGREIWREDEDGILHYDRYQGGLLVSSVHDANTALTGPGQYFDAIPVPVGWSSGGSPYHRITYFTYDVAYNVLQADGDESVTQSYRSVLADRQIIELSFPHKTGSTFYGPATFEMRNHARRTTAAGKVAISGNSTTPSGTAALVDESQVDLVAAIQFGEVCHLTRLAYDTSGIQLLSRANYFSIPASGLGTAGVHFDQTVIGYDALGRPSRRKEAYGTIFSSEYDVRGHLVSQSIGTNDSGTSSDNMVIVELSEYDGGSDGGNGFLTKKTMRTTATGAGARITNYTCDLRGHRVVTEHPTEPHELTKYDNLGRVVAIGWYKGSPPSATSDPEILATGRVSLSSTNYDPFGRTAQQYEFEIDPSTGVKGDHLRTDYWYDAVGRIIKVEGDELKKVQYDRLGRRTVESILATDDDARSYSDVGNVAGDIVLVESHTVYESGDSDDILLTSTIERFHDDHTTSPTVGGLDLNSDSDRLKLTASDMEGRPQITAMWYDATGRLVDSVDYGVHGGLTFNRVGLSTPIRSMSALRTTYAYDLCGNLHSTTDPKGIEVRTGFDAAGRRLWVAENYEDQVPEVSEFDRDQIVRFEYENGLMASYTLDLPSGTANQVTNYYYGTVGGGAAGNSDIATGHLLYQTSYPDSSGVADRITYAYNAQGEQNYRKDQDGTILNYSYDDAGRVTASTAVTLGPGIDGAVRRKEFAYDNLGRIENATQYDAVTGGSITDQLEYTYGEWGVITKFALDVDSAVGGGSGNPEYTCEITHERTWAAAAPTTRSGARKVVPVTLTLPSGFGYSYVQEAVGYHRESGRTSAITHRGTAIASLEYVGKDRIASVSLEEDDFVNDYSDVLSGGYDGWDDFNRVVRDRWVKSPGSISIAVLDKQYVLDEMGFATGIYNHIELDASHTNRIWDSLVELDDLNRIKRVQRGTLNGPATSIANEKMDQNRTLDLANNIAMRDLDWNADEAFGGLKEYDDSFTHNSVNEITLQNSISMSWSASGALQVDTASRTYSYDAWGRLCALTNSGSTVIARYRHTAADTPCGEQTDRNANGILDPNDWHYILSRPTDGAQLAQFRGSDPDVYVERLWVGGDSGNGMGTYSSAAMIENRDDDLDGVVDRTSILFLGMSGEVVANFASTPNSQIERITYDSFGVPFLFPSCDVDSDGDADVTDEGSINLLWFTSSYNSRADVDLDGDVDGDDYAAFSANAGGQSVLSTAENSLGDGALHRGAIGPWAPARMLSEHYGIWIGRDPSGFVDGANLYTAQNLNRLSFTDRSGLDAMPVSQKVIPITPVIFKELFSLPLYPLPRYWDCCLRAHVGDPNKSAGRVVCCGGRLTPCGLGYYFHPYPNFDKGPPSNQADAGIIECATIHEVGHIEGGDFDDDACKGAAEGTIAPWGKKRNTLGKRAKREQHLIGAEKECLTRKKNQCEAGKNGVACRQRYGKRERFLNSEEQRQRKNRNAKGANKKIIE